MTCLLFEQNDPLLKDENDVRELVGALQVGADAMDGLERELVIEMTLGAEAVALAPRKRNGDEAEAQVSEAYQASTPSRGGRGRGRGRGRGGAGRGGAAGRGRGMNEHMRKLVEAGYTQGARPGAVATSTRGAHR